MASKVHDPTNLKASESALFRRTIPEYSALISSVAAYTKETKRNEYTVAMNIHKEISHMIGGT